MANWQPLLNHLCQDANFPQKFLPLVKLNCYDFPGSGVPEQLFIFGLTSAQIFDFTTAFMEFGVQKKQFHRLYLRVSQMTDRLLSLRLLSELDFVNFARYWSEFQQCLFELQQRRPDL